MHVVVVVWGFVVMLENQFYILHLDIEVAPIDVFSHTIWSILINYNFSTDRRASFILRLKSVICISYAPAPTPALASSLFVCFALRIFNDWIANAVDIHPLSLSAFPCLLFVRLIVALLKPHWVPLRPTCTYSACSVSLPSSFSWNLPSFSSSKNK